MVLLGIAAYLLALHGSWSLLLLPGCWAGWQWRSANPRGLLIWFGCYWVVLLTIFGIHVMEVAWAATDSDFPLPTVWLINAMDIGAAPIARAFLGLVLLASTGVVGSRGGPALRVAVLYLLVPLVLLVAFVVFACLLPSISLVEGIIQPRPITLGVLWRSGQRVLRRAWAR